MTSFPPVAPGAEASSSAPVAVAASGTNTQPATAVLHHLVLAMGTRAQASTQGGAAASPAAVTAGRPRDCSGGWLPNPRSLGPLVAIAEPPVAEGEEPLWYCVTRGKHVGLTINNALAMAAVVGVSRSSMKSYKTQALALAAFNEMLTYNLVQVLS
ncbi:hypothetical protein B0H14DRAFT_2589682 [Mycena olivaceomarginata]|nr:hypothetical protein B0H14DRAFT_2589682 [Mycena olivaceomarginata]